MLTILQLSDIHFAYSAGAAFDLDREIEDGLIRFLPKVRARVGDIGLIVVCGDIAFSGVADQYERAKGFLRNVRAQLSDDSSAIPVRVIPGNHDIHRDTTDNADQRGWRAAPKKSGLSASARAVVLRDVLTDRESGPALLSALDAYNDFAAAFDCDISPDKLHWEHTLDLDGEWGLRSRGLTSVLVSNEHDEKDRLVLGEMQLLGLQSTAGEINLTLCHHPYCWLLDGIELEPKVRSRSHFHITGHVHQHGFSQPDPTHIHLQAGAMQPPRSEDADSRFNVITLNVLDSDDPELEVTVTPIVWKAQDDSFVFDDDNLTACRVQLEGPPAARTTTAADKDRDLEVERLTERLDALPYADRLHTARGIGLNARTVVRRPSHQQVGAIVGYAIEQGILADLWDQVDMRHGRQSESANPFWDGNL